MNKRGKCKATLYFTFVTLPRWRKIHGRSEKKKASKRITMNIGELILEPNKMKQMRVRWVGSRTGKYFIQVKEPESVLTSDRDPTHRKNRSRSAVRRKKSVGEEYAHMFPVRDGDTLFIDVYQCGGRKKTSYLAIRTSESREGLFDCGHPMVSSDVSEPSGFILPCGHSFCEACIPILARISHKHHFFRQTRAVLAQRPSVTILDNPDKIKCVSTQGGFSRDQTPGDEK